MASDDHGAQPKDAAIPRLVVVLVKDVNGFENWKPLRDECENRKQPKEEQNTIKKGKTDEVREESGKKEGRKNPQEKETQRPIDDLGNERKREDKQHDLAFSSFCPTRVVLSRYFREDEQRRRDMLTTLGWKAGGKSKGKKHGHPGSGKPPHPKHTNSGSYQQRDGVDFVFSVTWLKESETALLQDRSMPRDLYGNAIPFSERYDYTDVESEVFRYRNGRVTEDGNYFWHRENRGCEGRIYRAVDAEQSQPLETYKTCSVFRCWRFNPILWTASDVSVYGIDETSNFINGLRFDHSCLMPGVSKIDEFGQCYVVGRDPSWLPSLVPPQYRNPDPNAPQSGGLAGELPVIIGMMALSQGRGRFAPVASWRTRWHGAEPRDRGTFNVQKKSRGRRLRASDVLAEALTNKISLDTHPGPNSPPLGVVVQVCYDPSIGGVEALYQALVNFEAGPVICE